MTIRPSASSPELGKLVKECRLSPKKARQILFLTSASAAMALVCWLPAIFETNETPTTRIGISILGLFIASPMFVGLNQLYRLAGVSLSLYQNGLVYRRRGRTYSTTWDEIDGYILENACRITRKDGVEIEFGLSMEGGIEDVIHQIQKQTAQRRLPQIKAAIQAGASVEFKGLKPFGRTWPVKGLNHFAYAFTGFSVDLTGITGLESGVRIAWQDVKAFGTSQESMGRMPVEVFFIADNSTRLQTRLGLLSNAPVLLTLCTEMTGLQPQNGS
jgi:hypothetical protein